MHELGNLAREQTPLLTDLRAAAPGLNKLGDEPAALQRRRPRLAEVARPRLRASASGRSTKAEDEIAQLQQRAERAQPAADVVAGFLESLDDPRRAVEEDARARTDLAALPGEARHAAWRLLNRPGSAAASPSPATRGSRASSTTATIQTLALNQFDQVGHRLHLILIGASEASEGAGVCSDYNAGPTYPNGDHQDPSRGRPLRGPARRHAARASHGFDPARAGLGYAVPPLGLPPGQHRPQPLRPRRSRSPAPRPPAAGAAGSGAGAPAGADAPSTERGRRRARDPAEARAGRSRSRRRRSATSWG